MSHLVLYSPGLVSPRILDEEKKRDCEELNERFEHFAKRGRELYHNNKELKDRLNEKSGTDNLDELQHQLFLEKMAKIKADIDETKAERDTILRDSLELDKSITQKSESIRKSNLDLIKEEENRNSLQQSCVTAQEKLRLMKILWNKEKEALLQRTFEESARNKYLKERGNEERERLYKSDKEAFQNSLLAEEEHIKNSYLKQEKDEQLKNQKLNLELNKIDDKILKLQNEVDKLRDQKDELIQRCSQLDLEIDKNTNNRKLLDEEVDKLKAQVKEVEKEIKRTEFENRHLTHELREMLRTLENMEPSVGIRYNSYHVGKPHNEGPLTKKQRTDDHDREKDLLTTPLPPKPKPVAPQPNNNQVIKKENEVPSSTQKLNPSLPPVLEQFNYQNPTQDEDDESLVSKVIKEGNVSVDEINFEGKYLKIRNRTKDDIQIGGWYIQVGTPNQDTYKRYRFPTDTVIRKFEAMEVAVSTSNEELYDPNVLSFNESLLSVAGAFIQIIDSSDHLISHVALVKKSESDEDGFGGMSTDQEGTLQEKVCCIQ